MRSKRAALACSNSKRRAIKFCDDIDAWDSRSEVWASAVCERFDDDEVATRGGCDPGDGAKHTTVCGATSPRRKAARVFMGWTDDDRGSRRVGEGVGRGRRPILCASSNEK